MSQMGRPPRSRRRTFETIIELADAGEVDAADGGVSTKVVAEKTDVPQDVVTDHVLELMEEGKLERVRGISPKGRPRPSYLPTARADGGDEE